MKERDVEQRFHLLQREVEVAVSLIEDTKLNSCFHLQPVDDPIDAQDVPGVTLRQLAHGRAGHQPLQGHDAIPCTDADLIRTMAPRGGANALPLRDWCARVSEPRVKLCHPGTWRSHGRYTAISRDDVPPSRHPWFRDLCAAEKLPGGKG